MRPRFGQNSSLLTRYHVCQIEYDGSLGSICLNAVNICQGGR